MTDIRELLARALHEGRHKGLKNCWSWDDSGLDDEHPGSRQKTYRDVGIFLAALKASNLVIVPRVPSIDMLKTGWDQLPGHGTKMTAASNCWDAMLAASPYWEG